MRERAKSRITGAGGAKRRESFSNGARVKSLDAGGRGLCVAGGRLLLLAKTLFELLRRLDQRL